VENDKIKLFEKIYRTCNLRESNGKYRVCIITDLGEESELIQDFSNLNTAINKAKEIAKRDDDLEMTYVLDKTTGNIVHEEKGLCEAPEPEDDERDLDYWRHPEKMTTEEFYGYNDKDSPYYHGKHRKK